MTQKINKKVEDITLKDLVKEALTLPDGWKKEVYVENREVVFSEPLTQNTWVGKSDSPREQLNSYIGDLHSLTWGEIEGFYERKDGKIELDNPYDGDAEGENYSKVTIYTEEEAVDVLADYLDNDASEVATLLAEIQNPENLTVAQAVARGDYGSLVLEFGEKKEFNVENDLVETDQYGHLEVSLDSFLMSFVGVEEEDTIEEAMTKIKKYLLEHDIQVIGNPADETYDNHGNLR